MQPPIIKGSDQALADFERAFAERERCGAALRTVLTHRVTSRSLRPAADAVAVEAPLELRLTWTESGARREETIGITMRTPGDDRSLALGFLFGEGVIAKPGDVVAVVPVGEKGDIVSVELACSKLPDLRRLQRTVFTSSACGICGAPSLDAVAHGECPALDLTNPVVGDEVLRELPSALARVQGGFQETGGMHAAALFDLEGTLLDVREDVGRHNALDKLIGASFERDELPLNQSIVLVSGRASYELVQKAVRAGVPLLAAVGAPSSLAVDMAQGHDMTLIGFLRDNRFNIYHGEERVLVGHESY